MIRLGDTVKDKYSGFQGTAVARHEYVNGCARVTIQPLIDKEMKLPVAETFDELQLIVVEDKKEPFSRNTGGPGKYEDNRRY